MSDPGAVDPKIVVIRFIDEILNRSNPAAIDELLANVNLKQRLSAFLFAFPDLQVETLSLIAEGGTVASHLSAGATHAGPFQGMPATGKPWAATCLALYEVVEGRIDDFWMSWDLLAIMEQIGAVRRTEGASA